MHQTHRMQANRMRSLLVAPGLLALLFAASTSLGAQSASAPTTVQVAAHSSKWEYPREITVPPGCQLHIVERGDTLWDLAGKYLGNPYAWPQIWELNQWVKDPHWIYPGDPLIIDPGRGQATADLPKEVSELQPRRLDPGVMRRPELAYAFQDFLQMPFIAPSGADAYYKSLGAFTITANRHDERRYLNEGETVYLNAGTNQGVKAGDRFLALKTLTRKLAHPGKPKQILGDVIRNEGIIRVINAQAKGSVAVIERCLDGVEVGDHLVKFTEPATIPLQLRTDTADPVKIAANAAQVVYIRDAKLHAAGGDLIILDKGAKDGLKVGDVLLAARIKTYPVGPDGDRNSALETTTHYLGQAMVIRADAETATCRILRSVEEILLRDTLTQ